MSYFRSHLVPVVVVAWYVALAASTVGFVNAALTTRVSFQAPLEIVVPETHALRHPDVDPRGDSRVKGDERSGTVSKVTHKTSPI